MAKKVNPILTVRSGSSFRQVDFVSIGTPLKGETTGGRSSWLLARF